MSLTPFADSEQLATEVLEIIDLPVIDMPRTRVSDVACSLSIEHWHATRGLLQHGLLPSALVVHRAQFEALVRSVWLAYAASDSDVAKLTVQELDSESEQAAKNMPSVHAMMEVMKEKSPAPAYDALNRFKEQSWRALNSYTHAGVHPLRRHEDGYPSSLIQNVLCNSNGLGVFAAMHAVILSDAQPLQKQLLDIGARYPGCMPSLVSR